MLRNSSPITPQIKAKKDIVVMRDTLKGISFLGFSASLKTGNIAGTQIFAVTKRIGTIKAIRLIKIRVEALGRNIKTRIKNRITFTNSVKISEMISLE